MPLLLLLLFPAFELVIFIQVGARIGALWVLVLIFASMALGLSIIRHHSVLNVNELRKQMAQGYVEAQQLSQSLWMSLAGLLLIVPGFLSSFLGLLLLLPVTRAWAGRWLNKRRVVMQAHRSMASHVKDVEEVVIVEKHRIIEGEFREEK